MFDPKQPGQDQGDLVELRSLAWLDPAAGASHPRNTQLIVAGAGFAHEFVDQFRFVPGGLNTDRLLDQFWHDTHRKSSTVAPDIPPVLKLRS
jgi:hypothetical protein